MDDTTTITVEISKDIYNKLLQNKEAKGISIVFQVNKILKEALCK